MGSTLPMDFACHCPAGAPSRRLPSYNSLPSVEIPVGVGGVPIGAIKASAPPNKSKWYIYGITKYRDIFADSKTHTTKFCYMLSVNDLWDGQTAPGYGLCGFWNCADETCAVDRQDYEDAMKKAFAVKELEVPREINFLIEKARELDPD